MRAGAPRLRASSGACEDPGERLSPCLMVRSRSAPELAEAGRFRRGERLGGAVRASGLPAGKGSAPAQQGSPLLLLVPEPVESLSAAFLLVRTPDRLLGRRMVCRRRARQGDLVAARIRPRPRGGAAAGRRHLAVSPARPRGAAQVPSGARIGAADRRLRRAPGRSQGHQGAHGGAQSHPSRSTLVRAFSGLRPRGGGHSRLGVRVERVLARARPARTPR